MQADKTAFGNRRRLARALRGLSERAAAAEAPDSVFAAAAKRVEECVQALKEYPRRRRRVAASVKEEIRLEGKRIHYGDLLEFSPMAGPSNPLAPPMVILRQDEKSLVAHLKFSAAWEGGPGLVHGGYVAAAFDELLGLVQSLTGDAGMTGTLMVRYRSPCPLGTKLRMEGRVQRVEGRRIVTRGTLHAGERLVADAEATFVLLSREEYRRKVPEFGGSAPRVE